MELIEKIKKLNNNDTLLLDNKEYHIYQEDAFEIFGMYLSNTCTVEENPNGEKRSAIYLKDKSNVVIDGNNSIIVLHGLITPFIFENCKNITLKNISFYTAHPTMSEIKICSKENDYYLIKVHDDCLFDIKDNDLIFHSEKNKEGKFYWSYSYRDYLNICMFKDLDDGTTRTQIRNEDCKFPCAPKFEKIELTEDKNVLKVKLTNKDEYFKLNSVMEIRPTIRDQVGGAFVDCSNIVMDNCTFSSIHGFGILAECCENISYLNNKIIAINERVIACNADFFHFSVCRGNILIKNNLLQEGHDDFINIHGVHLRVKEVIDEKTIRVEFINQNTFGFNPFKANDIITFVDKNNLSTVGTNAVVSAELVGLKEIVIKLKNMVIDNAISYCVDNASASPKIKIINNHFGPSMGRGILVSSRGKTVIKNNCFLHLAGCVLLLADDCNFWFESGPIKNVSFMDNVIIDCGYNPFGYEPHPIIDVGPIVIDEKYMGFVHENLKIVGNKFISSNDIFMKFNYIKSVILKNNIYSNNHRIDKLSSNVKEDGHSSTKKYLLIGDSISYGEGADFFKGWARILNCYKDIEITNKSVRGYSAFNYQNIFERYVEETTSKTKIIVALGMNDSLLVDDKDYEPIEDFKRYMLNFVDTCNKYGRELIFIGPTQVDEVRTNPINWSNNNSCYLNSRIVKYDKAIQEIAESNNCMYISLYNYMKPGLLKDGVHPNNAGHLLLNKVIKKNLL